MSFLGIVFLFFIAVLPSVLGMYLLYRQNARRQIESRWQELLKLNALASAVKSSPVIPDDLPPPVKRYFEKVLPPDFKRITQAQLLHEGDLKIHPNAKYGSLFSSRSLITNSEPGFLWDAKVKLLRGVHVRVADSYIRGAGEGQVFFQSAFKLGSDGHHPKINEAALYRYLAESPWHPTSLLPENGVTWQAMNDTTALARFSAHGLTIALQFRFNEADEIEGIYTQNRYGKFGKEYERHPWEGKFANYHRFHGFLIPTEAEVGWHLPDGWWLFWRATLTAVAYHFQKAPNSE